MVFALHRSEDNRLLSVGGQSEISPLNIMCICGCVPRISKDEYGYVLECPKCGRKADGMPSVEEIVKMWNNEIEFEERNSSWIHERDYRKIIKTITSENKTDGYVLDVCKSLDIPVKCMPEHREESGLALNLIGEPYILVKNELDKEYKRAIVAHELGHIVLNHITQARPNVHVYDKNGKPMNIEDAADMFAYMFLSAMQLYESLIYIMRVSAQRRNGVLV